MPSDKKYFRISEISADKLKSQYNEGFKKGYDCGFYSGSGIMSYKPGYHTLMYGHPFSGKTQFAMEEMIYLSKTYGIKHLIYFPESGRKEEVVGDLMMVFLGQSTVGDYNATVDLQELTRAIEWLDRYFVLLAPEDGVLTLKDAFNNAHILRNEGIDIGMLWIDHFGYISKEKDDKYFSIADYVRDSLQFILRAGLTMNIHTVLMAHIRDTEPVTDKDTGIIYMPRPRPEQIAGGQQNWNNGYQMCGVWRAPEGVIDPSTGSPYAHNEMHIIIQKSKPKGIGRIGSFKLFFSEERQKLFETVDEKLFWIGERAEWGNGKGKKTKLTDLPF